MKLLNEILDNIYNGINPDWGGNSQMVEVQEGTETNKTFIFKDTRLSKYMIEVSKSGYGQNEYKYNISGLNSNDIEVFDSFAAIDVVRKDSGLF